MHRISVPFRGSLIEIELLDGCINWLVVARRAIAVDALCSFPCLFLVLVGI